METLGELELIIKNLEKRVIENTNRNAIVKVDVKDTVKKNVNPPRKQSEAIKVKTDVKPTKKELEPKKTNSTTEAEKPKEEKISFQKTGEEVTIELIESIQRRILNDLDAKDPLPFFHFLQSNNIRLKATSSGCISSVLKPLIDNYQISCKFTYERAYSLSKSFLSLFSNPDPNSIYSPERTMLLWFQSLNRDVTIDEYKKQETHRGEFFKGSLKLLKDNKLVIIDKKFLKLNLAGIEGWKDVETEIIQNVLKGQMVFEDYVQKYGNTKIEEMKKRELIKIESQREVNISKGRQYIKDWCDRIWDVDEDILAAIKKENVAKESRLKFKPWNWGGKNDGDEVWNAEKYKKRNKKFRTSKFGGRQGNGVRHPVIKNLNHFRTSMICLGFIEALDSVDAGGEGNVKMFWIRMEENGEDLSEEQWVMEGRFKGESVAQVKGGVKMIVAKILDEIELWKTGEQEDERFEWFWKRGMERRSSVVLIGREKGKTEWEEVASGELKDESVVEWRIGVGGICRILGKEEGEYKTWAMGSDRNLTLGQLHSHICY